MRLIRISLVNGVLRRFIIAMATVGSMTSAIAAQESIVYQFCHHCHTADDDGALSRISGQRKTPEGWQMTINRMVSIHGLVRANQEIQIGKQDIHKLVKYLADTQGLAPAESAPYRYLIEQRLNHFENADPELSQMCGRCHSNGRYALQRRTAEEWELLVHFHLGQFPTIEYQLYGRDRDWVTQAFEQTAPSLSENFPFESEHWHTWQDTPKLDLSGRWVFGGHMAGKGYAHMVMTANQTDKDNYSLSVSGEYTDGTEITGTGNAIVYTGYEWRGQLSLDGQPMRLVLAADEQGSQMSGRLFSKEQHLIGMDVAAIKDRGVPHISQILPGFIAAGEEQVITLVGTGLDGPVKFSGGLSVAEVLTSDSNHVRVRVSAPGDAGAGVVDASIGSATSSLMVHRGIDALEVEPAYAVARIGGNGPTADLKAAFRAVAKTNGPDNVPQTDDDVRLGYLPSVTWRVEAFDDMAAADDDAKFAGKMDPENGIFSPAGAGPNPARRQSTNNAGNLKVIASAGDLQADAQLIVSVQVWISPPLK